MAPNTECNCLGYAAQDASGKLAPWRFPRRACGAEDVSIKITHCGICHSDLHQVRGEWGNSTFPMVPGHEIVGLVTEVGASAADKFRVGDRVGVGCMVRSCKEAECRACSSGEEQFCPRCVFTYNAPDWADDTTPATQGGYSTHIVTNQDFVVKVPDNLPMDAAAPLLCAGITTYTPLVHFGLNKPGTKLAVVGLGGLGHMAVKFGKAFGCHVTVISTSESKRKEATEVLGADAFLISKNEEEMAAAANTFDGIIDTVSAPHDAKPYLASLRYDGKFVVVGAPPADFAISPFDILFRRLTVAGSLIGGMERTQEMLDFCGKHGITCEIETIKAEQVNEAMVRLEKGDVHYRFVIDIENTLKA